MAITYLPCLDGEDRVAAVKDAVQMDRHHARGLGESAVMALEQGVYVGPDGSAIDWADSVAAAVAGRVCVRPEDPLTRPEPRAAGDLRIQVRNATTLMVAREMAEAGLDPLALNVANGVSPGGGFRSGARAQEETLCRSSALSATLMGAPMYEVHAHRGDYESSAYAVLSPRVPVFRLDDGTPLEQPWLCSFITSAAPVAGRVGQPRSGDARSNRTRARYRCGQRLSQPCLGGLGVWCVR